MKLDKMTKDEKSLLLYLETRAVDHGGRVAIQHMNISDMEIAEKWNKIGFIGFGRIVARHINRGGSHWCKLSDDAWKLAHTERKRRFERLWLKKDWLSTEESRKARIKAYRQKNKQKGLSERRQAVMRKIEKKAIDK